jgi:AraC family transcriptional regulator
VASWCNRYDQTRYHKPGNHTISVYLQGGEQTERLDGPGGHGGAGKVCIMPDHHRSEWLVREEFRFFHLYFTPAHFTRIAEQACDKEGVICNWKTRPSSTIPGGGPGAGQLMKLDWQHGIDRMALSHGAWMLMLHAYRHHTREAPALPEVRGGLAPAVVRRVQEYLQAHLAEPVTLGELAREAGLSEYHFARMFGQSLGCPPHRYLLGLRLKRAKQLLAEATLASIAAQCGFSSQAHFGNRFREAFGLSQGQWRAQLSFSCHR